MKILVANLGSTSFKYRLFDMSDERQLARGGRQRLLNDVRGIQVPRQLRQHPRAHEFAQPRPLGKQQLQPRGQVPLGRAVEKRLSVLLGSAHGADSKVPTIESPRSAELVTFQSVASAGREKIGRVETVVANVFK